MTKFYVDDSGNYLGGFQGLPAKDGSEKKHSDVPPGAIEVSAPPKDARQVWDGAKWSPSPPADPPPLETEELYDMLKAKGVVADGDRPRRKPTGV